MYILVETEERTWGKLTFYFKFSSPGPDTCALRLMGFSAQFVIPQLRVRGYLGLGLLRPRPGAYFEYDEMCQNFSCTKYIN